MNRRRTIPPLLALVLLIGCGGSSHSATDAAGATTGSTTGTSPTGFAVRSIALATNRLVYDASRDRIWASPVATSGTVSTIEALDPSSGDVKQTVNVGPTPDALALSGDATTLYVGIDGANSVRRVDLTKGKAGASFALVGRNGASPPAALELAVAPDDSNTVAVVVKSLTGTSTYGPIIYDGATARANYYAYGQSDQLAWWTPSVIVDFNSATTSPLFSRFSVGSTGVTLLDQGGRPGVNYSTDLTVADGRVYTTDGSVFDAVSLDFLGRFDIPTGNIAYGPAVDLADKRAYFIESPFDGPPILHVVDTDTFAQVEQRTLPMVKVGATDAAEGQSNLIFWGSHGLAFRTNDRVYFIDNAPVD